MRTVKEVSELTGISVRTLHYYDEIGLFSPTEKSEAGYRLYDDKAMETLQQILFFREFDIPLKEIKTIMQNPAFDRNRILEVQRRMLVAKKEHIERLILSIDDIVKGDNRMDFEVFSKAEVEEIFQSMLQHMNEEQKKILVEKYGDVEKFHEHFMENVSKEETQKSWAKMVEWYGGKDKALEAAKNPVGEEAMHAFHLRQETIMQKLFERKNKGYSVNSFEIKELIGEYGFVQKQLFRIEYEKDFMLQLADICENKEEIRNGCDKQYGKGAAQFFAEAIKEFYKG